MYKEKSQLSLKYKQRKVEIMRNFQKIHNNEKLSGKVKKHNQQEEIEMIHKDGYSGQKQVWGCNALNHTSGSDYTFQ